MNNYDSRGTRAGGLRTCDLEVDSDFDPVDTSTTA